MESLREFEELTANDERNTFWLLTDPQTNEQTTIPLKEWHQQIKSIKLSNRVPEKVKSEFNVARNLATYSWFCYSFHKVAKSKVFSILERVLAEKYNHGLRIDEKSELELLLTKAMKEDSLKSSDLLVKEIPSLISKHREDYLQGTELYENSWLILKICAELINQIYRKRI